MLLCLDMIAFKILALKNQVQYSKHVIFARPKRGQPTAGFSAFIRLYVNLPID